MDSETVLKGWLNRSGAYSPDYYAHYGPTATSELIREVLSATVGPDATVLELGCSSGRHLAHLHEGGYRDLWGIDINSDAFDVMREAYPDLAAAGTFFSGAIEDVVTGFDDGQFDAVYSVETLQHLHPDHDWVFAEVARVTDDVIVTVRSNLTPARP
jgi:SAM-dependent methyltransferase